MGEGLNRATLVGNLGMDPELKFTQAGQAILRIRLATSENYKDKSGERQERTEWHTVTVWGKRAEALNRILRKGRTIAVEGRIQTRSWETDAGEKRYATEINASNIVLVGKGDRDSSQQSNSNGGEQRNEGYSNPRDGDGAGGDFGDDDIPF